MLKTLKLKYCYAAIGTFIDDNFYVKNFEDVVGHFTPEQRICSLLIKFAKKAPREESLKYFSTESFKLFLMENGKEALSEKAEEIFKIVTTHVNNKKQGVSLNLPEPGSIYKDLFETSKKQLLFRTLENISKEENFKMPSEDWTEEYSKKITGDLDKLLEELNQNNSDQSVFYSEDIVKEYSKILDERENGKTYSFHNKILDELVTEGPTPGHGGIIGGSTGMGKSTLCLNVINDLIDADVPCMYFPIEMGLQNTIDRLVSMRTGVPYKTLTQIGKTKEDDSSLKEIIDHEMKSLLCHTNFAICADPVIDMKKLRSYVAQFQAKLPGDKYCVVFIDLLLMIKEFYDNGNNMAQQIERAINMLDILAKELSFHWVGVVQLGRAAEADKVLSEQAIDKLKPTRTSIKNSNALLERARYAITIFRKKYFANLYLSEEEASGIEDIAEIQLLKANNEEISRRYASFEGQVSKVTYLKDYGKSSNGF